MLSLVGTHSLSTQAQTLGKTRSTSILSAEVLLVGEGDELYSLYGHLVVKFTQRGAVTLYDLGVTRQLGSSGLWSQILGRSDFTGEVKSFDQVLIRWKDQDRTVVSYPLGLDFSELLTLKEELESRTRGQGRSYLYDPLRENCGTQIRRILDTVTYGAVSTQLSRVDDQESFRVYTREGYAQQTLLLLAIEVFVGATLDLPRSQWALGYRPEYLVKTLQTVRLKSGRSLLGSRRVLATRQAPLLKGGWRGQLPPILCSILIGILALLAAPQLNNTSQTRPLWLSYRLSVVLMGLSSSIALFFTLKSGWPEVRSGWMLILSSPLDLGLLILRPTSSMGGVKNAKFYLIYRGVLSSLLVIATFMGLGVLPTMTTLILAVGSWWACFLCLSIIESGLLSVYQTKLVDEPIEDDLPWAQL